MKMKQDEMLQLIFEKLVSLEQGQKALVHGQKALEQGQKYLEEGQHSLEEGQKELKAEIIANRQAILEVQDDVKEIKQSMRYYDYKLVEHEKQLFKLQR
jgi:peptidoglycan hydrolase CwlO-like protein